MRTFSAAVLLTVVIVMGGAVIVAADVLRVFVAQMAELLITGVKLFGALTVATFGVGLWWWVARTRREVNRQRDGAFALREYWLDPLPRRIANSLLGRASVRVLVDVNAMMTHAALIGEFGVREVEPVGGYDRQLAYMQAIEGTRRTQSVSTDSMVAGNPFVSLQRGTMGVPNAPTARLLAGAYDKTPRPVPPTVDVPMLPPPPVRVLSPVETVAESSDTALALGQTDSGDVVRWDLLRTPHLRVHGMTQGSGKTNLIQTAAAGALRTGAHVVVMDRVQFKDWAGWDGKAELIDTADPNTLADANARLLTAYHARTTRLAAAKVRNIASLPNPPRRIIVVVSEFGAQCEVARAEGVINDVLGPLSQLLRLAAATGIHFIFEDQVVDKWPRAAIANSAPIIGRMPDHAGQACGWHGRGGGTGNFAPYTFAFDGQMFRAPHMQPALPSLLATVPPPPKLLMNTPPSQVRPVKGEGERSTVPPDRTFHEVGEGDTVLAPNTPTPTGTAAQERNAGTADEPGRWDDVVAAWFAAHPQALTGPAVGISDLARAMCLDNEGSAANYEAYKGRAHPLFHEFRKSVRLPSGDRLGTDITGNAA